MNDRMKAYYTQDAANTAPGELYGKFRKYQKMTLEAKHPDAAKVFCQIAICYNKELQKRREA